uniref:Histone acetyltransferase n=1 Tax=Brugia malayi TaxID=6279 RepID=A0A0J9XXP8_BRUMA|nr:BMA-MYS-4 [Brugia malayi]
MKTRKRTSEATKASRKRQQQITFVNGKVKALSTQTASCSRTIGNGDSRSRRIAAVKKTRLNLQTSADSSDVVRKSEKILAKVREYKQQKSSSIYSPIKTRGLYKRQSRGTDRCRLCKISAGGFMTCSVCENKYHLECLGYAPESIRLVSEKRCCTWLCPTCIYCYSCNEFIYDPENVQCFACDTAFHGTCKPPSGAWINPKDPLSSWFCSKCKHLLDIENSESSISSFSSSSSLQGNGSTGKKLYSWHLKRDCTSAYLWKAKLQAERDAINDQLKDSCHQYLEEKEQKERNKVKRQIEREDFSLKKKIAVKNAKKVKRSDSENESARNINIVDGIKISVHAKRDVSEQLTEAEKHRVMKDSSTAFDHNLYTTAKREFLAFQPSEDLNADEERPPQTQWVHLGSERLLVMYPSPYPKRIAQSSSVYLCRFCLLALEDSTLYEIHAACCEWKHPPGNEIYRDDRLSFWEIDGIDEIAYCRRLCLLSKLFLFSKTLHHEVETFLFYILTEYTAEGYVLLGYFSKEKNPSKNNNLSCLLTLPSSQRTGYGKFLIDLSYKLSLRERKIGGPEHPLSDMGLITYRKMSNETGIHSSDIISTMLENKMLKYRDGGYLINKKKAFATPLRMFRRRVVHDAKLIWEPEFDVDDEFKKMGTYVD